MAVVWIEGFETHINSGQLARKYASSTGSFTSSAGRVFGISGGTAAPVYVTPSFGTDNTFVVGFGAFLNNHLASLNTGNQGLYCETGTSEQIHLELESTSGLGFRWHLKRGATTLATSAYFDFGVWHYFELKVVVRTGTNGSYELRHNGVLEFSGTSVNTADAASDGWDVFAFRYSTNAGSALRYDDMYVLNATGVNHTDFLGPQIVEGLLPNANGTTNSWTQNGSGDNYTSVDDAANSNPDDTGVGGTVGSDTNGQKDLYNFADLQNITGTINAVQVGVQMAMASAGTRTVKTVYRDPDTTEADGDSHVVDATTFDEFTQVLELNPTSAAAWDVADIDGGQFGVEVVS